MDAALFTPNTLATPGISPTAAVDGASPPGQASTPGGDFGAILSSLQPLQGRQDLAAVLFAQTPNIGQLVSVPLGSSMAVITPQDTPPSQDSLMAFARSQGLDETAIAALWQPSYGSTEPTAAPAPELQSIPAGQAEFVANTLPSSLPDLPGSPVGQAGLTPATTQPPAPVFLASQDESGMKALTEFPREIRSASAAELRGMALTPHVLPARVLALTIQTGPQPASATDDAAAPAEPGLDLAALQGMRAQLLMQGQRPANRPATSGTAAPEPLLPPGPPGKNAEIPILELDLADELTRIGQSTLALTAGEAPAASATEAGSSVQSQPQEQRTPTGPSSPQATVSGYQLKAEHYQQLADRMGQALAQRLLEQIDRGQWSMQLRLNPSELGQIDVRLEMRQAGLDAHFQADNPLTKELIQQGAGRLKDNLVQNGMTLASMSVGGDAERQSSGNPTPQHEQRRASPEQSGAQTRSEPRPEPPAAKKTLADGWDMLA